MSDALMGLTEVSATSKAMVEAVAQKYLIQESKMMPLVLNYSNLAVPGANSIKLPRAGGFTVASKAENTAADASIITFAADTLNLDVHRYVQFLIEDIANGQASVDAVSEGLLRASKDLAYDIDKKILDKLIASSTASPDHVIQYTDATNEDIELNDILEARRLLQVQNIDPRECYMVVGAGQEKNMLKISDFIDASKYGSNAPIMNGEIGMVYGVKVVLHNYLTTSNKTVMFHPTAAAYALQQSLRVQKVYDLANLGWRYSVDYIGGFASLDIGTTGSKRSVVIEETP